MLKKDIGKVEGFIFATPGLKEDGLPYFVENIDLLHKFSKYFKREAAGLIGKLRSDQFTMQAARKEAFFELDPIVPLAADENNRKNFLI